MMKVGIAGLGRWGKVLIESVQARSETIRFVAATTGTPAKAVDYAKTQGIELVSGYAALMARGDLDGVVIATPHTQHTAQMLEAYGRGLHVFVEKPMVPTLAEAEQVADAAARAKRQLAVGFNRRFYPATRKLKSLIDSGALGTIQAVESNMSAPGAYRYSAGQWRANPVESPAGGMSGMGIHVVDAMIGHLGPMKEVTTRSRRRVLDIPIDDTTMIALEFASGVIGTLTTLTTTSEIWQVRVLGSEGWAEMRGYDRLVHARRGAEVVEHVFPATDTPRAELEAFAAAAAGKVPYAVTVAEALQGVAAYEAIVRSAASGRPEAVAASKARA